MENAPSFLATIVFSLTLAYAGALVARAVRLPPLIGYLLAGVAVGPFTPGFVANQQIASEFAEIGIALMLFGVGIHFSVRDLIAVWHVAVPGALVQVAISASVGFAVAQLLFGWDTDAALVLGTAVAIASTAVATRVLEASGHLNARAGHIALGWLVMQDLVVVLALVLLPSVAGMKTGSLDQFAAALGQKLLQVSGFVAIVLFVGRALIPRLLAWTAIERSLELFRLAVIVVALGVAYASAELAGVSIALGAFFAGVVLAESDLSHQAAAETIPIQQVFTVLFFVSAGMLFDPIVLVRQPLQAIATVLTIVLVTGGCMSLILILARVPPAIAFAVAAALAQIGEFSFILTGLAVPLGMLSADGRDIVIGAAIITIVINPLLVRFAERAGVRLEASPRFRSWQRRPDRADAQSHAPGTSDHVIIVGHGRVGSIVAARLRDQGIDYLVVEQNLALARAVRDQGVPVVYGDAGWPEVLEAAHPETASLLIIAIPEHGNVRRIVRAAHDANPDLPVIVRTHSDAEAEWLRAQAIERVVMSEQRTGDEIAEYALKRFSDASS
jgi:CPA2 family monovalent cation:H+ antiporter-2